MIADLTKVNTHDLENLLREFNALPVITGATERLIDEVETEIVARELDDLAQRDIEAQAEIETYW